MPQLTPLSTIPPAAVEALLDRAFGADRHGRTAYRLRVGVGAVAEMSFAALDEDGRLLGTIQCWPLLVGDAPATLVGPVAVDPKVQGRGIGRALMDAAMAAADASEGSGAGLLVMIGDPDYYGRFWGFSADATAAWMLPGPVERHRLLARMANGVMPPVAAALAPGVGLR